MNVRVTLLLAAAMISSSAFAALGGYSDLPPALHPLLTTDGEMVADAEGKLLYVDTNDKNERKDFVCADECLKLWPPLQAASDAKPVGDWTLLPATDGSPRQWAFQNEPVHVYGPGGDPGVAALSGRAQPRWRPIRYIPNPPEFSGPGGVRAVRVDGRFLLADERGRPLYTFDCQGRRCDGWTPFPAGLAAHGIGKWTVKQQDDRQVWGYEDKVIFTFDADTVDGKPNGMAQGGKLLIP